MRDTSISAKIKLRRDKNGLLKSKPAIILFDSRFLYFYLNDTKEFEVKPGTITISINKKKHLTFQVLSGDTKEFVIKEGIYDWRFLFKYGILLLLTIVLLWSVVTDITDGKNYPSGLIGLAFGILAFSGVRHEYFYLEEQ